MISIIVPIYNAAGTLSRCIESVQAQTYNHFELILINDGSKDESLSICRHYAEKDNRIIVLDQPNGGVASARNAGLAVARGEYLYFIDPDDYAEPDLLERMLTAQADLAVCSYRIDNLDSEGNVISTEEKHINQAIESTVELIKEDTKILFPLWNKLFCRSYVEDYNIRFLPLSFWEDACFVWEYLKYADKISCIDIPMYHYTVQKDKQSLSRPKYVPNRKRYYLALFRSQNGMCTYREITDEAILSGNYVRLCYNLTGDLIGNINRADANLTVAERVEYIESVCAEPEVKKLLDQKRWDNGIRIKEAKICLMALRNLSPDSCEKLFALIAGIKRMLKR